MPTVEPIAVQLAVMANTLQRMQQDMDQSRADRKEQYKENEEQGRTLLQIVNRLDAVEASLKQQAPTIEEFITIKHKVVGAGLAGKWVWLALSAIIGFIFSCRVEIIKWLTKS